MKRHKPHAASGIKLTVLLIALGRLLVGSLAKRCVPTNFSRTGSFAAAQSKAGTFVVKI